MTAITVLTGGWPATDRFDLDELIHHYKLSTQKTLELLRLSGGPVCEVT